MALPGGDCGSAQSESCCLEITGDFAERTGGCGGQKRLLAFGIGIKETDHLLGLLKRLSQSVQHKTPPSNCFQLNRLAQ